MEKMQYPRAKRSRIIHKFLAITVVSIVVSVLACGLTFYWYLSPILSRQAVHSNRTVFQKMAQQVSFQLQEAETYARNIAFDADVQRALRAVGSQDPDSFGYYATLQKAENSLRQYVLLRDNLVWGAYLVDPDGQHMGSHSNAFSGIRAFEDYTELLQMDAANGFTLPHTVLGGGIGIDCNVIAYVSNVVNTEAPYHPLGKLVLILRFDNIADTLRLDEGAGSVAALFDATGGAVYLPPGAEYLSDYASWPLEEDALYFDGSRFHLLEPLEREGWWIAGAVLSDEVRASFSRTNVAMAGIIVLCSLVMAAVVFAIMSSVTRPLGKLIDGMRRVSRGDRDTVVEVHSRDEIQELAIAFNTMVRDINHYIAESLEREKKEYAMTLQMLIYQINPHFIYNTLNSVICLARRGDCEGIGDLVRIFIALLRNILQTDPETRIPLREEVEHIDNYIRILQYSYRRDFRCVWEIGPGLDELAIPKLLLYPIVENSFFHGVLPKEGSCEIRIRIFRQDGRVFVEVRDNGYGMDASHLAKLRARIASGTITEEGETHIGLANINRRLALLYGPQSALQIESDSGAGTVVRFSFA